MFQRCWLELPLYPLPIRTETVLGGTGSDFEWEVMLTTSSVLAQTSSVLTQY